jgi:hypothetical protein
MDTRQFGEGGRPVHVAVAHQDELRINALCEERFCKGFVEFGHGHDTLWWRPAEGTLLSLHCWESALPDGGFKETLYQASAQAKRHHLFLPHKSAFRT